MIDANEFILYAVRMSAVVGVLAGGIGGFFVGVIATLVMRGLVINQESLRED